jgi:hypothetical protein
MSEIWNYVGYGAFSPCREVAMCSAMLMAPLANCLQTAGLEIRCQHQYSLRNIFVLPRYFS